MNPAPSYQLSLNGKSMRIQLINQQASTLQIVNDLSTSTPASPGSWAAFVPLVVGSCAGATRLAKTFDGPLDDQLQLTIRLPAKTPAQGALEMLNGIYALCLASGPYDAQGDGPTKDSEYTFYPHSTLRVQFAPPYPPPLPSSPPFPLTPPHSLPATPPPPTLETPIPWVWSLADSQELLHPLSALMSSEAPAYAGHSFSASSCIDGSTDLWSFCMSTPNVTSPWLSVQVLRRG
ncbi:MAG: hypothetical protein SGPRY_006792 [Prymnesium sp.]